MVALGFRSPDIFELGDHLRVCSCKIDHLGHIIAHAVKVPDVLGEVTRTLEQLLLVEQAFGHVIGGRFPPIVDDGP